MPLLEAFHLLSRSARETLSAFLKHRESQGWRRILPRHLQIALTPRQTSSSSSPRGQPKVLEASSSSRLAKQTNKFARARRANCPRALYMHMHEQYLSRVEFARTARCYRLICRAPLKKVFGTCAAVIARRNNDRRGRRHFAAAANV